MGPPYLRIFRTIYGSVFVAVAVAVAIAACGGGVDTPSTSAGALGAAPSVLPDGGGRSLFDKPAGCSHFTVVARDASGRQFLVINTDTKSLGISAAGDETTVDLATPAGARGTKVTVDTYATAPTESMYCTDWVASPQTPARATATRGKVTFRIAAVEREDKYAVTVSLSGVVVRAPDGSLETITDVTYTSIDVGWLPG